MCPPELRSHKPSERVSDRELPRCDATGRMAPFHYLLYLLAPKSTHPGAWSDHRFFESRLNSAFSEFS